MTSLDKNKKSHNELSLMATAVRTLSIDMVEAAKSGHPGAPMGLADVCSVLWAHHLKFDNKAPHWPMRDRFILSNGHASALQYALLHLSGYDLSLDDLRNFRQLNSKTPGHPEYGHTEGVETTTGPLGQGLGNAVGMALALKREHGANSPKVYVVVGDGCLMEGISHETAELAVHWQLDNLVVLFDDNGITIDGPTDISLSTNQIDRFSTYGFAVQKADGHDFDAIDDVLNATPQNGKPHFIALKTQIGFGSPNKANSSDAHGAPLGSDEAAATKKVLNWEHAPFFIPENIYTLWQSCSHTADTQTSAPLDKKAAIKALQKYKEGLEPKAIATRAANGNCIPLIAENMPNFISGSADLTGSNKTLTGGSAIQADNLQGNYLYYGVREQAMGAIMNGLSLSGCHAAGGTFLTFTDYIREPMRLAALMQIPTTFVMTHDSLGVGEDGPTHQPVEHISMLRATPNIHVWRPADEIETIEAWQCALENRQTPAVLALSRQKLPPLRSNKPDNLSARGGYVLKDSGAIEDIQGIFIATGSEVHLARQAQDALLNEGVVTRVVSMPCVDVFLEQDEAYQQDVLPPHLNRRVIVEAGCRWGWDIFAKNPETTRFITIDQFGVSAPGSEALHHFGFSASNVKETMQTLRESESNDL